METPEKKTLSMGKLDALREKCEALFVAVADDVEKIIQSQDLIANAMKSLGVKTALGIGLAFSAAPALASQSISMAALDGVPAHQQSVDLASMQKTRPAVQQDDWKQTVSVKKMRELSEKYKRNSTVVMPQIGNVIKRVGDPVIGRDSSPSLGF